MAVDLHFEESLLRQLKLEDPWLPPKPWESVPSESGASVSLSTNHVSAHGSLYDISSVSVRYSPLSRFSIVEFLANILFLISSSFFLLC